MNAPDDLHYFSADRIPHKEETVRADVAVYGATSGGIVAAVRARLMGKTAVLLNPGRHVGGMTSGGLGYTDMGNKDAIGGLSRQFYRDLGKLCGMEENWKFEPHKALAVFTSMIETHGIDYRPEAWLDAVEMEGKRIRRVIFRGGLSVEALMFVDATYEGDLMAMAGVPWTMGRESSARYGEDRNGQQVHDTHQFDVEVDPWVEEGNPASGLLPFIERGTSYHPGAGDLRIQAYNFRVCMTDDPVLRMPFQKPENYRPEWYELAARFWERTGTNLFQKFDRLSPPTKTDTNNHGAVSTDFIGANQAWIQGGYEAREAVFRDHVSYQQGLHWFMANSSRIPRERRNEYARWGLSRDEFTDTGGWPPQLYIREARRMIGDYVLTQENCTGGKKIVDPVGMAAYQMDSHNVRRFLYKGRLRNEGDVQVRIPRPYAISYRAIVPPRGSVSNLFVTFCLSASHIAFGSVRMEPVFMVLSDSAAQAACLAIDKNCPAQDLPYSVLEKSLEKTGQSLSCDAANRGDGNPGDE